MSASSSAFCDSPCRKELGNPEVGHSYPSVEELKNIWIPHAIKMRLTKNKELDVCNWSESDEVKADDSPVGRREQSGCRAASCRVMGRERKGPSGRWTWPAWTTLRV